MNDIRIKRIIHRANYRGFKEADLILGSFAKAYAASLSSDELSQLEALLAQKDHDIYDWINGSQDIPKEFDTPIFTRICAYKPEILT